MSADGEREAHLVDAFTTEPFAGAPAGVVTGAGDLSDEQRRALATELGAPETAFLWPADDADRALRVVAPDGGPRRGHAAVAAFGHLHEAGAVDAGLHAVRTPTGPATVEVEADGTVWVGVDRPSAREAGVSAERVGAALGVDPARFVGERPYAVGAGRVPHLVVAVDYLSTLRGATPDRAALAELCADVDARGCVALSFDTLTAPASAHARAFLGGDAFAEAPATATGCVAAAGYLRWADVYDEWPDALEIEMGHGLDRPGTVRVRVDGDAAVGGEAATALEGRVATPPAVADDIVEL